MHLISDDVYAMLQRIRGEFREMPGLTLTIAQAARLWQLDPTRSQLYLDRLVDAGTLRRSSNGVYRVAAEPFVSRVSAR